MAAVRAAEDDDEEEEDHDVTNLILLSWRFLQPERCCSFHLRFQPGCGPWHRPRRCIFGDPLRQQRGYLDLAQKPHPGDALK